MKLFQNTVILKVYVENVHLGCMLFAYFLKLSIKEPLQARIPFYLHASSLSLSLSLSTCLGASPDWLTGIVRGPRKHKVIQPLRMLYNLAGLWRIKGKCGPSLVEDIACVKPMTEF